MLVVGCGNQSSTGTEPPNGMEPPKVTDDAPKKPDEKNNDGAPQLENPELYANPASPVTIKVFQQYAGLSDLDFTTLMKEPVEAKFPNITLELVRATSKVGPAELIAQGDFPDFIFTSSQNMADFMGYQLPYDMTEFIKKYNIDLNRFESAAIDEIKSFGEKGELYALPFSINFGLLFYNKNIFDELALPYPKDNMTWDQTVDLAKQIGAKAGDKYHAFDPNPITRMSISWLLQKIDPKTNKALFTTTPGWKKLYETYAEIHRIPGNEKYGNEGNRFFKDKNVAMIIGYGGHLGYQEQEHLKGNDSSFWDFVTFPEQSDGPKGIETEVRTLIMSVTSKNKDIAFKVMNYLTSDEVQTLVSRKAQRSSLKDSKVKEMFGADFESLKGKNIEAIFKQQYNTNPKTTIYDTAVKPPLFNAFKRIVDEHEDVNTALRKAEEEANKIIESMQ
jgi:multiple sugar transport system substrate-binding protein